MKYRNAAYDMNKPDPIYRGGNAKMDAMLEKFGLSDKKPEALLTKSQGALNRSERANIVLAAKESWGKSFDIKDKLEIENIAEEIAEKANEAEGVKISKEERLRKMVANAGLGKLARKGFLRNGQRRKLRASQLMLAVEAGNTGK